MAYGYLCVCNFKPQLFAHVSKEKVTIYSCAEDGSAATVRCTIKSQKEKLKCCAWIRQGKRILLAIGGSYGIINIFDPISSVLIHVSLYGHGGTIRSIVTLPQVNGYDKFVISAGKDQSIRIWNIRNWVQVAIMGGDTAFPCSEFFGSGGHRFKIWSLAINEDGTLLASSGAEGIVKVWDLQDHSLLEALQLSDDDSLPAFIPVRIYYPKFSTRNILYGQCIVQPCDFVRCKHTVIREAVWNQGALLTASDLLQGISMWLPEYHIKSKILNLSKESILRIQEFIINDSDYTTLRFCVDREKTLLACGNKNGEVLVWKLDEDTFPPPRTIRVANDAICHVAFCRTSKCPTLILISLTQKGVLFVAPLESSSNS